MKRSSMAALAVLGGIMALTIGCSTPPPTGKGVVTTTPSTAASPASSTGTVSFSTQVKSVLTTRCTACHSGIDGYSEATKSSRVTAGNSAASPLYTKAAGGMGSPTDAEKQLIKDWIDQGAKNN